MTIIHYSKIDQVRQMGGFLSIQDTINLIYAGNQVFDPFSTLISSDVKIGTGNIFYPGSILKTEEGHVISIGDENIFHSGCLLEATRSSIKIGNHNQLGEGGFTAKANRENAEIKIGNFGRYLNNPAIFGKTTLGDGTQILGNISVDSCQLDDGRDFNEPDPDKRGGLLKGFGAAKGLHVPIGHVIASNGDFASAPLLPQTHFHPEK